MAIILDCKGIGAADGLPLNSSSITAAFLEVEPICRHTYETMMDSVVTADSCVSSLSRNVPCCADGSSIHQGLILFSQRYTLASSDDGNSELAH